MSMVKVITDKKRIKEVLEKGVENIYPNKQSLEKVLLSGKRIKLYCGFDPTSSSLHLGSAIQIRKLAQFQNLGHEVVFLIGDFTGMIGDPTDKSSARQKLSREQIKANLKNYKKQASKILNFSGKNPAKVLFNSEWNDRLKFIDLIELASNFTVQQMIIRDMFQQRIKNNKPIYLHEFLYPLTQAYDSVAMNVDLEVGGNDQTFNMLCGRDLMGALKNKEKFVLTTKLLSDPSGKKMGKTEGNIIGLEESPREMFGKIMSWPDGLIFPGFELCTDFSLEEINKIRNQKNNPRDDKAKLAKEIVKIHHNEKEADSAEKEFNKVFKQKELPTQIPTIKISGNPGLVELIIKTKTVPSKSEARRLIIQGAVRLNNKPIKNWQQKITPKKGMIIQIGKRKFIKIV